MQVDEQIGSNLLGDEMFLGLPPLEELVSMNLDNPNEDGDDDGDHFSLSFLQDNTAEDSSSLPFEERYKATLTKLAESMERCQATRMSLKMETQQTTNYTRTKSVSGVLTSIEKSSHQLQLYLKNIRQA